MGTVKQMDVEQGAKVSGSPKRNFGNQFNALFRKSLVFQSRQYRTNCCQITFPVLIIVLLFILQIIVTSFVQNQAGKYTDAKPYPQLDPLATWLTDEAVAGASCPAAGSAIPPHNGTVQPGFVWYSSSEAAAASTQFLVQAFSSDPILYFKSQVFVERGFFLQYCRKRYDYLDPVTMMAQPDNVALEKALFNAWSINQTSAAYYISELSSGSGSAGALLQALVVYNRTLALGSDLPVAIHRLTQAFVRWLTANTVDIIFEGLRNFPQLRTENDFDLISLLGPNLYIFVFQLIFPVILGAIVYEKECKLREVMKMMGLDMRTYWLVTYIFSFLLYFVAMMIMWAFAALLGFRYFTANAGGAIFLLIFLWGHTMVAAAFLFSAFFNNSRTAAVVGYMYMFISGLLSSEVIQQFLSDTSTPSSTIFVISIVPSFALFRGLIALSHGVSFDQQGVRMNHLSAASVRLNEVFGFLVVEWLIMMLLAFYLEAVLPTGYGVKRHPLFFLKKEFWTGDEDGAAVAAAQNTINVQEQVAGEPEDVAAERRRLLHGGGAGNNNFALEIQDLNKVYPAIGTQPAKVAVKSLALAIDHGQCFGFLGPNGAGKSTTISCVSGLFPPTTGTARVYGMDIRTQIDQVHMVMGVCPQDNVLWEVLTGREHLLFYGRLKNLNGADLENAVNEALKAVNLHNEGNKRSGQYSGGMKRRLSVACSLMGNPKIVLLDEPSTGLDPASRRQLWDVINTYKRRCAMLLTTHAMEEADALCDRIGIFAEGSLRCLGTSTELKSRFGKGFKIMLTSSPDMQDEAHRFLMELCPDANLLNALAGTRNYEVPKASVQLSRVFSAFEQNKERLHITDWGISNTTLEEVFLRITNPDDISQAAGSSKGGPEVMHLEK